MIRVLIRASSPVVKAGLESLLRAYAQFELVNDRSHGEDLAFDSFDSNGPLGDAAPDVVLAELDSGESTLGEALEEVESAAGENSIPSVLLVRDPPTSWSEALRHGARAVLPATATAAQIAAAIEAVAAGLFVFEPDDIEQFLSSRSTQRGTGVLEPLAEAMTPREIEILRAMAEGLANKEIAARFRISENTVKFHVGSVMGKLGAASRTEAVMLGIRRGMVLL